MDYKLNQLDHFFFIGVAGVGMSAIAQFLAMKGKVVSGSDRLFSPSDKNGTQLKLEAENIQCFYQDASGIDSGTKVVVLSTAIEKSNVEWQKAEELGLIILHRSELLKLICDEFRSVAIAGTSGKSTTCGMLYHILEFNGKSPSFISGAGLIEVQKKGKLGNAMAGDSEILILEADESDGTVVRYHPKIGVLLNIDLDHKSIEELQDIFSQFQSHSQEEFIANLGNEKSAAFSQGSSYDFSIERNAPVNASHFEQVQEKILFQVNDVHFEIPIIGRHNVENALAATSVALKLGLSTEQCADALKTYEGIYRRHQIIGKSQGITVVDDYAHNPEKIRSSIKSCQNLGRVIAWFQPHGFAPTKFLRKELVQFISETLRPEDQMWMTDIYYAGGTVSKDISSNDLIEDLKDSGSAAFYTPQRSDLLPSIQPHLQSGDVILLMGARDPSLEYFARDFFEGLKSIDILQEKAYE